MRNKILKVLVVLVMCAGIVNAKQSSTKRKTYVQKRTYKLTTKNEEPIKVEYKAPSNKSILNVAKSMVGESSASRGGRLGCAAMVSAVFSKAGVNAPKTMSTEDMYFRLRKNGCWTEVSVSDARPGDVIISPTEGRNHGHVGVVGENGKILSNDSDSKRFLVNYTFSSWRNYFGHRKGLDTHVFRYQKNI